jgi:RNA polymerase sigma-70 factor (ECF subfamily)
MPDWRALKDDELIDLARNGEVDAFGEIYSRYADSIFRYLYAHLNDVQDAEDLMADVFLRTWRALPEFQPNPKVPFYVFLYRIARNRLIDHYRRAAVRQNDISLEENDELEQPSDASQPALQNLERIEMGKVIQKLRSEYRTVLVLRFLNGLTPEETAQVMQKSVGAVRVLQHRALRALQKLFVKAAK